jgi:leucyl aminopeptidase
MKIHIRQERPESVPAPLVVLPIFEGEEGAENGASASLDSGVRAGLSRARSRGDFLGREGESLLVYPETGTAEGGGDVAAAGAERVVFLGMGSRGTLDRERVRAFAGSAVRKAEGLRVKSLHLIVPALASEAGGWEGAFQSAAEGLVLGAHDFREFKSAPKASERSGEVSGGGSGMGLGVASPPPLVESASLASDVVADELPAVDTDPLARGVSFGCAFAEGENLARTLQARPGNVATPTHLAATALQLAEEYGFQVRILGPKELEEERMGALLGVSQGSDEEPRLIVLEHWKGAEGERPLVLVGKGLTFDSGGISIKPALGMEEMKYDMSGGAAVLGAMKAIGLLGLPVSVVGVVPSSENLLNGRAVKPGDILRSRSGKTIEVHNTDAEGRLILADALDYARERYTPRAMVDCATLTGACVIALGSHASAVLGTDEGLVGELRDAGDRSGERCWPLPLWDAYRKQLDSTVADLKNIGGRPAGTITAALFLREFVGDTPWAHLDIAGTAYGDEPRAYLRKGGYGVPTRLLLEWVRARAGQGAKG